MSLNTIGDELREKLSEMFPFVRVYSSENLGSTISVIVSKDTEWANGILENSRYCKMLIFCNTRNHMYTDTCTLEVDFHSGSITKSLRNKKSIEQNKVCDYVVKQFAKVA